MEIKGFVDMSLVDWDGRASAVLFLPRCDFRCPYCQNAALVLHPENIETIPYEKIRAYLKEYRWGLGGVVITGGEPTLHRDLPDLCTRLKELGFPVKLDTNGTRPEMLEKLMDENLIDYVAMDIKAPLTVEKYSRASGVDASTFLGDVRKSIALLMSSGVPYEFRTTVVPTLHTPQDVREICMEIRGCMKYVLQNFRPGETLNPEFNKLPPFTRGELQEFLRAARRVIPNVSIRP